MKITKSAQKALDSGISGTFVKPRNQGQIAYELMYLTTNGKAVLCYVDRSYPTYQQIREAKIIRVKGKTAIQIVKNYTE
jgi:hypothetical protein